MSGLLWTKSTQNIRCSAVDLYTQRYAKCLILKLDACSCYTPTALQPYSSTTLQLYNSTLDYSFTTLQLYNSTAIQLYMQSYNSTALQPYSSTSLQLYSSITLQLSWLHIRMTPSLYFYYPAWIKTIVNLDFVDIPIRKYRKCFEGIQSFSWGNILTLQWHRYFAIM